MRCAACCGGSGADTAWAGAMVITAARRAVAGLARWVHRSGEADRSMSTRARSTSSSSATMIISSMASRERAQ